MSPLPVDNNDNLVSRCFRVVTATPMFTDLLLESPYKFLISIH